MIKCGFPRPTHPFNACAQASCLTCIYLPNWGHDGAYGPLNTTFPPVVPPVHTLQVDSHRKLAPRAASHGCASRHVAPHGASTLPLQQQPVDWPCQAPLSPPGCSTDRLPGPSAPSPTVCICPLPGSTSAHLAIAPLPGFVVSQLTTA